MTISEPFPGLDELLESIGEGGRRVAAIDAGEGAAGNISVCLGWPIEVRRHFPGARASRPRSRSIVVAFGVKTTLT
jgi:rhamnulose-1-phosphate aldolase